MQVLTGVFKATEYRRELEKAAINDALPLKAVRRDAIVKLKSFIKYVYQRCHYIGSVSSNVIVVFPFTVPF